ncbi:hypothetical protein D9M68_973570 [compost metagenome]
MGSSAYPAFCQQMRKVSVKTGFIHPVGKSRQHIEAVRACGFIRVRAIPNFDPGYFDPDSFVFEKRGHLCKQPVNIIDGGFDAAESAEKGVVGLEVDFRRLAINEIIGTQCFYLFG